jgi:hypothetical protein
MSKIYSQEGLDYGLTSNNPFTILFSSKLKCVGIFGYYPLTTLLKRPAISSALKGGFNVTDS